MIISLASKPIYLGAITTITGGAAVASVIALETSKSPIRDNISKLGESISKLRESSSTIVQPTESGGSLSAGVAQGPTAGSILTTKLQTGVQSAKEVYQGLNSLIRKNNQESTVSPAQLLNNLKELYENLRKSGTTSREGEGTNSNKIQLGAKAIQEGYKNQTNTSQKDN